MDQSARFWNKMAESYSKKPIPDEVAYEKKLQVTREYLRPDMEVLEFGCGTGSTAIIHAPYVKHIQAVDFSLNMLEIAQRKVDAKNIKNITFKYSTIENLSMPDQTLDMVMGHNILQLLENKEEIIAKVHKMLKPDGIFVTSTACIGDIRFLNSFFKIIAPIGNFLGLLPLLKVFTSSELEDSLTNGGFRIDYQWQPAKNKGMFIVAKKCT